LAAAPPKLRQLPNPANGVASVSSLTAPSSSMLPLQDESDPWHRPWASQSAGKPEEGGTTIMMMNGRRQKRDRHKHKHQGRQSFIFHVSLISQSPTAHTARQAYGHALSVSTPNPAPGTNAASTRRCLPLLVDATLNLGQSVYLSTETQLSSSPFPLHRGLSSHLPGHLDPSMAT
jgi:hypothetical protein